MKTINDTRFATIALAQALRREAGKIAGTAANGLRTYVDRNMQEAWEAGKLGDEKSYKIMSEAGALGTYRIMTEGGYETEEATVTDMPALLDWLRSPDGEEALTVLATTAPTLIMDAARATTRASPPGITTRTVAEPTIYKCSTIRCTDSDAHRAVEFEPRLRGAFAWLEEAKNLPQHA